MRPTRLGVAAVAMAGFTLFVAGSTTNNLLYLLFSAAAAALALAVAAGRWSLRGAAVRLEAPAQVFRGTAFAARLLVTNVGPMSLRTARVVGPNGASDAFDAAPGETVAVDLRLTLPHRGRDLLDGLRLETPHPFGFFVARRLLPPVEVLALPPAGPFHPQPALDEDPRAAGGGTRRKARDGEFFGPRPYTPDDDARLIHWKLTAKTGAPVVAEYSSAPEGRVTVRVEGVDEASVERAAAACRWYVDAGVETGLAGPGVEVAPGKGLTHLETMLRALALVGEGGRPRSAGAAAPTPDEGAVDTPLLRRATLAGGALVYAAMFLIDDLSPRALLAFAPFLPLGVWLRERGGPYPPLWLWNVLSAGMLLFLIAADWRRSGVVMANVHLLGYLLFNRLFSPWPRRELRQVFLIQFLAFLLVSGLTISPWYFPLVVAYLAFAGAWLTLQSGAEPRRWRAWGPALGRMMAAGALVATAVFVVVPRVEGLRRFNPFVASGMDKLRISPQAVIGFTDRVSLGRFSALRRSSARALRVIPEVPPKEGEEPSLYVRGAAFDAFDGETWSKTPLDFAYAGPGGKRLSTTMGRAWGRRRGALTAFPSSAGPTATFDVAVYPMQVSVVFTVGAPRSIDGIAESLWFDHTDSVLSAGTFGAGGRYRVVVGPPGTQPSDAGGPGLRERILKRALFTPPDPGGRVGKLAAQWTAGLTDPRAKIDAVTRRLRREYSYSLSGENRRVLLPEFLFEVRRGNCEYFATAAAVLLRHAGVPTRLVTGFRSDDWNQWGRFYDVRQSNAHAWVEAWVPGAGWVSVDATPAESGFSAATDALSRRLQRWADDFQARWYRSVIGYDQYSQRDAFQRFRLGLALDRLRALAERALTAGLPALVALGLLWWALRALPALLRRGDEYERAERALARAGLPRRPELTPREYARGVIARRPELAELDALVDDHYRRRYAGVPPTPESRRRAAEVLSRLKARL
ncbi:MAG: DUF3488 domain-containing protein [Elusimicrobia bacterium]|nr:DUF3488 domain-containing protein [Elusimicrobiota bacterium]